MNLLSFLMNLFASTHAPGIIWLQSLSSGTFFHGHDASFLWPIIAFIHLESLFQLSVQPVQESRTIRRRLLRDQRRAKSRPHATTTRLGALWHLFSTTISQARKQEGKRKSYHPSSRPGQAVALQKGGSEPGEPTEGDLVVDQRAKPRLYRPGLFTCVGRLLSWAKVPDACWALAAGIPLRTWASSTTIVCDSVNSSNKKDQKSRNNERKNGGKKRQKKSEKDNTNAGDDDQSEQDHSSKVDDNSSQPTQLWACPYYKFDREKHRACGDDRKITRQSDIKQHLKRVHELKGDYVCPTCGKAIKTMTDWRKHHEKTNCSMYPGPYNLFSDEQDFKMNESTAVDRWFRRWEVLFSGHPRPQSPFVGVGDEERENRGMDRLRETFPDGWVFGRVEDVLRICFGPGDSVSPERPRRIRILPPTQNFGANVPLHSHPAPTEHPNFWSWLSQTGSEPFSQHQPIATSQGQPSALNQIPIYHELDAAGISNSDSVSRFTNDVFMGAGEHQDANAMMGFFGPPALNDAGVGVERQPGRPAETVPTDSQFWDPVQGLPDYLGEDDMDMT